MYRNFSARRTLASLAIAGVVLSSAGAAVAQTTTATTGTTTTATAVKSNADKGLGRGGRGGFGAHADTIAKALGLTAAQLQTELASGKSIAAIASAKGVAVQTVIDAYLAEEVAEHPGVDKATLTARVTAMVNGVRPKGVGADEVMASRPAGGRGFGAHAETIAKSLGMTAAQLQTELAAGKSVAQVASAKGVALQTVIDAYVAEEVAEHPEQDKATITTRVTNMVNGVRPTGAPAGRVAGDRVAGDRVGGGRGRGQRGPAAAATAASTATATATA
jgi:voltage-gated potassium channel Kch